MAHDKFGIYPKEEKVQPVFETFFPHPAIVPWLLELFVQGTGSFNDEELLHIARSLELKAEFEMKVDMHAERQPSSHAKAARFYRAGAEYLLAVISEG